MFGNGKVRKGLRGPMFGNGKLRKGLRDPMFGNGGLRKGLRGVPFGNGRLRKGLRGYFTLASTPWLSGSCDHEASHCAFCAAFR